MSDSLRPHALQHARLPCASPTPKAYSNSYNPTISSSVVPLTYSHNLHFKITELARRFNPETVLRQDALLLYNPCKDQVHSHNLHFKITELARRFNPETILNPETVLRQDTLLLYNPKECREGKKVCSFFLLENFRPLSPWGPLDFLSTCLGNDSLNVQF